MNKSSVYFFSKEHVSLKGELYKPPGFDPKKAYPTVLLCPDYHPNEIIELIAKSLANEGFITLSFIYANHENSSCSNDALAAYNYLSSLSYVDSMRIGVFGIKNGGLIASTLALSQPIIKVIALSYIDCTAIIPSLKQIAERPILFIEEENNPCKNVQEAFEESQMIKEIIAVDPLDLPKQTTTILVWFKKYL